MCVCVCVMNIGVFTKLIRSCKILVPKEFVSLTF